MLEILDSITQWYAANSTRLLITLVIITCYLVFRRLVFPRVEEIVTRDRLKSETLRNAIFTLNLLAVVICLALLLFTWGFDLKSLLAMSTGLIAITGVAMFANWSILSNITAFFILVAHQSYRRGNFICVIDADNFIEGYISEINLFNTKLVGENREIIIYPNNFLIARPIIVNPRVRHGVAGKVQDFQNPQATGEDK